MAVELCDVRVTFKLLTVLFINQLTMGWTVRDRIRGGRDFPPVQAGPGAHPASCTMGAGSFPEVKTAGTWG